MSGISIPLTFKLDKKIAKDDMLNELKTPENYSFYS